MVLDEVISSTAAGLTSTLLGAPLDAVKVRMQHLQRSGLTTWACAGAMLRTEGVGSFFRGLGAPLLTRLRRAASQPAVPVQVHQSVSSREKQPGSRGRYPISSDACW